MRVKLGEVRQAPMFLASVQRDPALRRGKIVLVGWILVVFQRRFGACPQGWLQGAVCVLRPLKIRGVCSGCRKGRGLCLVKLVLWMQWCFCVEVAISGNFRSF